LGIAHGQQAGGGIDPWFSLALDGLAEYPVQSVLPPPGIMAGGAQCTLETLSPHHRIAGGGLPLDRQVEETLGSGGSGVQGGFSVQVQQITGHDHTPVRTTPNPAVARLIGLARRICSGRGRALPWYRSAQRPASSALGNFIRYTAPVGTA